MLSRFYCFRQDCSINFIAISITIPHVECYMRRGVSFSQVFELEIIVVQCGLLRF